MLFSSLTDPVDIARAEAAFEAAWEELATISDVFDERKRTKLACIVAALVAIAQDEDDLKRRAIARYRREGVPSFSSPAKGT
ncbi:hypothetical protein FQV39_27925 [Bosea sp. F3-2]|uniref:hypothetical protein n=1 Tax=Bosea sp. F3-2 TaxID=2599640 RepID=UPI0011ED51EB|nr:hypothetical protein [Bosea sp. F3-2]QEL26010.1 hypothetical protein FQV39_27925 [Bosea sp. F3-2]